MTSRHLLLLTAVFATLSSPPASGASVSTFAGTGVKGFSGDGGPANAATLNNVFAVARGPDGALYFCDTDNQRIRRILADGHIETVAGNGTRGYAGEGGPATAAALNEPYELAWDRAGHLFFVERLNHLVRRVDLATGTITTWAGTGEKRTAPDGSPITGSSLHGPRALAFGPDGTCWLALREGNALLRLDPKTATLRRVAGTSKSGFTGNGGPALEATLAGPKGVALDPAGNVYLADTESHSIRYLDIAKNTIEVLVGDGKKGDGPDGDDPLKTRLARPHGVYVDRDGAVFIGDSENHRVRVWRK